MGVGVGVLVSLAPDRPETRGTSSGVAVTVGSSAVDMGSLESSRVSGVLFDLVGREETESS